MATPPSNTLTTARDQARSHVVAQVLSAAGRQLSNAGAGSLSLRAIARELGIASSAIYRYVPSRDALLTLLIVQGYDDLGAYVEDATRKPRRADLPRRWTAICRSTREWAAQHPSQWALLYGSPVPGYAAPQDTVPPAARVPSLVVALLADAVRRGRLDDGSALPVSPRLRSTLKPAHAFALQLAPGVDLPDELLVRGLAAWEWLVGAVSYELSGHRVGSVADDDTYVDEVVHRIGTWVGLLPPR